MAANDAIALLKADHKEVAEMLEKFETARSTKEKLAQQIAGQAREVQALRRAREARPPVMPRLEDGWHGSEN